MTVVWFRLNLVSSLSVIALSGSACGGRADDDGNKPGTGGQAAADSGGGSGTQGGQAQGGQAQGGQAQGGQAQGGQAQGGKPTTGGKTAVGGSAQGGSAQGGSATGECTHLGQRYKLGETFFAGDACNTCRCAAGTVVCSRRVCEVCPGLDREYVEVHQQAKRCDPTLTSPQCEQSIAEGLYCTCNGFVNSANSAAIERMKQIQAEHAQSFCAEDGGCDSSCGEGPFYAFCSAEGLCQDRWDKQRNCMVSGKVYPSGTTGIPDPGSCNTCLCDDGNLSCTEINCPTKCPDGAAVGMQCAECTPTGVCLMPDYECLPTCTDSCPEANQVCIGGLCKSGMCG